MSATDDFRDLLICGRGSDFEDMWRWLAIRRANDEPLPHLLLSIERSLAYQLGADERNDGIEEAVRIVTESEARAASSVAGSSADRKETERSRDE